ncbi:MAG: MATE family efflux transporter [Lachnospiraceae bacterium]|nr:MATE family efflux transporter [Lachnospiraceae bacterium]
MENTFYVKRNPLVIKTFMSILIPTILMNLTTAIGSMADTVIIGQYLDDLSLSVVTYATPVYMVINTLAALFAVGGCIAMSVDIGKGDKKSANRSFSISMEFLLATALILFISGIFFTEQITYLLGAGNTEVFEQVKTYVKIILMGAPIFIMNIAIAFFVRNDGRPNLSMAGMFTSIVVDITFNLVFVGYMNMGVAGAAYSTVLGQGISVIIIASHFFSSKNTLRLSLAFDRSILRIIKNGIGSALTFIYQFITIIILNHYVVSMAGEKGVVIYTVVFNLCTVSLAVFEGLSQTIQPMVGVYYGENSNKKIKGSIKLALLAAVVICGSIMLVLEIIPEIVPHIFGIADIDLVNQSSMAVRIYATSMLIMTVNVIIGYYLQSIEMSSMASVLISLRCCVLLLASTFVLSKIFGVNGIWAAYTVAEFLTLVIFGILNILKRKKLSKNGTNLNLLFLNKDEEKNTSSFILKCNSDDFESFNNIVISTIEKDKIYGTQILNIVKEYLVKLQSVADIKTGKYIEVEKNNYQKKVIIRDNINHSSIRNDLNALHYEGLETEYGPVLGLNRLCIKGAENNE